MGSQLSNQPQTAPTPKVESAPGRSPPSGLSNNAAEAQAGRARAMAYASSVPSSWHELGGDLFKLPAADADDNNKPELAAFAAGAYGLLIDLNHRLEPLIAMLSASPERAPYLEALRGVARDAASDRPKLEVIATDVADLGRGGDVAYNTRHIVTAYATLSARGRPFVATAKPVDALRRYAAGNCAIHGRMMTPTPKLPEGLSLYEIGPYIERANSENGERRVSRVGALIGLLTGKSATAGLLESGTPKEVEPGVAPSTTAPSGEVKAEELEKTTEPLSAESPETVAQEKADALAEKIRAELKQAAGKGDDKLVAKKRLAELVRELKSADRAVIDRVYADAALVSELMATLDAAQAHEIIGALDTVEALYQACSEIEPPRFMPKGFQVQGELRGPVSRDPFALIRDYLLARPGDEARAARLRVLAHDRLKVSQIDRMAAADKKAIYRLIANGTLAPSLEDAILDGVKSGDGVGVARALMQLAAKDPSRLAALRDDLLFRTEIERLDREFEVDGLPVNPFHLCLTMWGLRPKETADPGAMTREFEADPMGCRAPITIEDRMRLERELFEPTMKALKSEIAENIVDDDDMVAILRSFEKLAAIEPYLDWLRREGMASGPALVEKYNAKYSTSLRGKVQEYTSDNERRECERILGIRVEGSAVGTIGGAVRLASDKDTGPIGLARAMSETTVDGQPLAQHTSRAVDVLLENLIEIPGGMGGYYRFAHKEPILERWSAYSTLIAKNAKTLCDLTGIEAAKIHPIELLTNAFQEKGGDLAARIERCFGYFGRANAAEVLAKLGLRAEDKQARAQAADARLMVSNPAEGVAKRADQLFADKAKTIFAAIATLRADGEPAAFAALRGMLTAARSATIDVPSAATELDRQPTRSSERGETSFDGFYRKHYGIDPDLHISKVLAAQKSRKTDVKFAEAILGVEVADTPVEGPSADELVINESNRHLVRANFTVETARSAAAILWRLIHGGGKVELVMNTVTRFGPEEQRLIRMGFRELSGGIDLAFYIQQQRLINEKRGPIGFSTDHIEVVGGEGTTEGKKVAGDAALSIAGDESQLDTALTATVKGSLDIASMMWAAGKNADIDQIFFLCDEASQADCKAIVSDTRLMSKLYQVCDQYAWDRVYKTLTGQADLTDRLYSRAHGAYDSWNPFDSTDEAGMRKDIKAYVRRLRRQFDAEVRKEADKNPDLRDPKRISDTINSRVKEACQRLMVNPDVRAIIEDELSGDELAEVEGLILHAGEETSEADVSRAGKGADAIIAGIRRMSPAERARKREDALYLEKLGARLADPNDYRAAIDALRSESTGEDNLGSLDTAVSRLKIDRSTGIATTDTDADKAFSALIELDQSELARLAADPSLQSRVLSAITNPEKREIARRLLALRLAAPSIGGGEKPSEEKLAAADSDRLKFVAESAAARIEAAALLGWDTMLKQCVEVFKLDFEPRQAASAESKGGAADKASGASDLASAAGARARFAVWKRCEATVTAFADRVSKETRHTRSTISDAGVMLALIREAILGHRDPSAERVRENLGGEVEIVVGAGETRTHTMGNDHSGLKATIAAASSDLLIESWTTIKQPTVSGGASLKDAYQGYRAVKRAAGDVQDGDRDNAQAAANAKAIELRKARFEFLNYVPDISRPFEELVVPHVGDENELTRSGEESTTRARDNKKYHELVDIVREKIPSLTSEHGDRVGKEIGIDEADRGLLDSQNRKSLTAAEFRQEKYVRSRGEQAGSGWAAHNEAERVDQLASRYQHEVVLAQLNSEGGLGLISEGEGASLEEKGKDFDDSLQAFKDAKAKVAFWMSMIVGVLVTALVTVLTGGAATGFVGMLFWSTVSAGLSAAAKAAINEAVMDVDYDFKDEGVKMIGREMLTAFVTAGTTFMAQKMISGVSGATSMARQARAAEQVMRTPPPFWRSFLNEASEEVVSETMSGTIDAALEAIDPVHWMHGVTEGSARALPAAKAKLAEVPTNALKGGITSLLTAGATRVLGSKKSQLRAEIQKTQKAGRVNLRRNFGEVFGDQREAVIATFVEWSIDKIGGGKMDLENVPAELFEGYLQEMNEKSIEMHTKTAHAGGRSRLRDADAKKHEHLLSKSERDDFHAMQESASETDPYVSIGDYQRVRQAMISDALLSHAETSASPITQAQAEAYSRWVREAGDATEFQRRLTVDPLSVGEVASATTSALDPSRGGRVHAGETTTAASIAVGKTYGGVTVVAKPASIDAGHAIMARLAAGDAQVLTELGFSHDGATDATEWGLGVVGGQAIVIRGGAGEINFDDIPGITALAHTHPATLRGQSRALDGVTEAGGGIDVAALLARGKHSDLVHLLPSQGDLRYFAENGIARHVVYTPYVHLGGGKIGNPDAKAAASKRIAITVEGSQLVGRSMMRPDQAAYGAQIVIRDGEGNELHRGPLYQFFFPGLGDQPSTSSEFLEIGVAPLPRAAAPEDSGPARAGDKEGDGKVPATKTSAASSKTLVMDAVNTGDEHAPKLPADGSAKSADAVALERKLAATRDKRAEIAGKADAARAAAAKATAGARRAENDGQRAWMESSAGESELRAKYEDVKGDDEYAKALGKVREVRANPELAALVVGIPDHELVAVFLYTDYHYRRWNEALRSGDPEQIREHAGAIKAADNALAKLPDYEGWVDRGAGSFDEQALARYQVGAVITEESFTSTSYGEGAEGAFLGGEVSFRILSHHGKKVTDLAKRGEKENEVLFRPGTKFKVVDKVKDGDSIVITMEEVEGGGGSDPGSGAGKETTAPRQREDGESSSTSKPDALAPSPGQQSSLDLLDRAIAEIESLGGDADKRRGELEAQIGRLVAGLGLESSATSDAKRRVLVSRLSPEAQRFLAARTGRGSQAATSIAGSSFTGTAGLKAGEVPITVERVVLDAQRAVTILGPGLAMSGDSVTVTIGEKPVTITFAIDPNTKGEGARHNVARHTFKPGQESATVFVAVGARHVDVARAIAHELAEIRRLVQDPESFERDSGLTQGKAIAGKTSELNHHDVGRLAEIMVLLDDLDRAEKGSDAEKDSFDELAALMTSMGLAWKDLRGNPRKILEAELGAGRTAQLNERIIEVNLELDANVFKGAASTPERVRETVATMIAGVDARIKQLGEARSSQQARHRYEGAVRQLGLLRADLIGIRVSALSEMSVALVRIGRRYDIPGLSSLQGIGLAGHENDGAIYGALVELGSELRSGTSMTGGGANPVVDVIAMARPLYATAFQDAAGGGAGGLVFAGHALFVEGSAGYVFPESERAAVAESGNFGKFAYSKYLHYQVETLVDIGQRIAAGAEIDEVEATMFVASLVAEAHRNVVAEVTSRIALAGDPKARAFGKLDDERQPALGALPMAVGKSMTDRRDRDLDGARSPTDSAVSAGFVTDAEVEMAKRTYNEVTGRELSGDFKAAESPAERDAVKTRLLAALRARMMGAKE